MAKLTWVGLAMCVLGCLGATIGQTPVTPAQRLQQAQASAERAEWPEARESAVAFWVGSCKRSMPSADDCASAQLVRGEAALATEAPESAFVSFDWILKNGPAAKHEKAQQGLVRATDALQKLLEQRAQGMTWLVVEQDFEENHKFGPERAAYTLNGQPLGDVTSHGQFSRREHRVLAQPIAAGKHQLAVEIHWQGQGTFSTYLWSSFTPFEFEAVEGAAVVVSLDVTYNGGGPSNSSVEQYFRVSKLP